MKIEILIEYILQEIDVSARFYKKNIIYHPNVKKNCPYNNYIVINMLLKLVKL
jgi:hypothetical protein